MSKRRPSGDGMVRKREDGRWEGRIVIGHKENGEPLFRHVYAKTQKALLDKLGIQFWRTDHGWMKADTMEDCMVIDDCLGATVCKNLFLCNRQKTNFYLLMMPGDKPFKTKELSHQLGISRLSFASPEDMEQYLDCTPGSSSVMGLANDKENKVQLLMDEDVVKGEFLGCHPCINTSSLKLYTKDVLEKFLPAVHHEPVYVVLNGD